MPARFCRPVPLYTLANQAGMKVRRGIDGRWEIRKMDDNSLFMRAFSEEEARAELVKIATASTRNLDEGVSLPTRGVMAPSSPGHVQDQVGPLLRLERGVRSVLKQLQVGTPLARATPIYQLAANIEFLHKIPAQTKIFDVLDGGARKIGEVLTGKAENYTAAELAAFGVKPRAKESFEEGFIAMAHRLIKGKFSREQQELITLHSEAFTKEELEKAGVLLTRGMNPDEIEASALFSAWGLAEEIPSLMRKNVFADLFIQDKERFLTRFVPRIRQAVVEGTLPPEMGQVIDNLLVSEGKKESVFDLLRAMQLTDNEISAAGMLRSYMRDGEEFYNIPAIYRHATAPKLDPQFRNGREQFAALWKMDPELVGISEKRMGLIRDAFGGRNSLSYTPNHNAPTKGSFTGSGGDLVWTQHHDELVRDAVHSWKGDPAALRIHMHNALSGAPQPGSGSGKQRRAQAEALIWELNNNAKVAPKLYRGSSSSEQRTSWVPWSEKKATAQKFAGRDGQVREIEPGASGIRLNDYFRGQFVDEKEWILRSEFLSVTEGAKGFSADQVVFAQLPVFRHFIDNGLWSGKQVGAFASSSENKAIAVLNGLAEGSEVLSRRVLGGHINPHELDPIATTIKHVRNMLLREHYDAHLPEVKKMIQHLDDSGFSREAKFIADYVHEVGGGPAGKFEELNAMVRTVASFAGAKVDDRVAEKYINTLSRVASQSALPFRVAPILRNALQSPFLTIPLIGAEAWSVGLKVALGDSGSRFSVERYSKAIQQAVKDGVVDPNILPVHASSEIFGRTGSSASKISLKAQEAFDLGFSWYRSPDDIGRVIASEGMKYRYFKHAAEFRSNQITLDELMKRAKITTFDEVIQAEAARIITTEGDDAAAKYLGRKLADKVHFLYGHATHPPGWGGATGRLFGQFGTFPVQYLNYVLEGSTRNIGSKDWYEFIATHSALNIGVIAAGDELLGLDLQSWSTFGSLTYTGGPYLDMAINLVQAWGGTDAEKALAVRALKVQLPWPFSPEFQSPMVPGSYAIGDLIDGWQANDATTAVGEALGFRFLRPGEKTWVDKAFGWVDEIR